MKNILIYPAEIAPTEEWLMCNALIGAKSYAELNTPISFNEELAPNWYREITDDRKMELVWQKQDEYVHNLLSWLASKNIIKTLFDGAYEEDESWFLKKYALAKDGSLEWKNSLIDDLLKVNIYNVYIEANDGSILIAYESWDTVFIKDSSDNLPSTLKEPTVTSDDLN